MRIGRLNQFADTFAFPLSSEISAIRQKENPVGNYSFVSVWVAFKTKAAKRIFSILFFTLLLSCSPEPSAKQLVPEKKNTGVEIYNKMMGGMGYVDSAGKAYAYRTIEGFIKNDTTVAVKIELDIPEAWSDMEPKGGEKFVCFLVPDSIRAGKEYDNMAHRLSTQLSYLISTKPESLRKQTLVIQPKDTFSYKLGFLLIHAEGRFNAGLFSQEISPQQNTHDLKLYITMPPLNSVISVGSLTFIDR